MSLSLKKLFKKVIFTLYIMQSIVFNIFEYKLLVDIFVFFHILVLSPWTGIDLEIWVYNTCSAQLIWVVIGLLQFRYYVSLSDSSFTYRSPLIFNKNHVKMLNLSHKTEFIYNIYFLNWFCCSYNPKKVFFEAMSVYLTVTNTRHLQELKFLILNFEG